MKQALIEHGIKHSIPFYLVLELRDDLGQSQINSAIQDIEILNSSLDQLTGWCISTYIAISLMINTLIFCHCISCHFLLFSIRFDLGLGLWFITDSY